MKKKIITLLFLIGICANIQAMEHENGEHEELELIKLSDLDVDSELNKKNRKELIGLHRTHPILGFKELRSIVEEYLNDKVHFVLQTPPQITGFLRDWQPDYPPIHSLEFKDNTLIAKAIDNDDGYDFVITWNLKNNSCYVDYAGSNFRDQFDAYSFFIRNRERYNKPCVIEHNQLTARVDNLPLVGRSDFFPSVQHRKKLEVVVSLPRMLMWQSIKQRKSFVDLNSQLLLAEQIPPTPSPKAGKSKTD